MLLDYLLKIQKKASRYKFTKKDKDKCKIKTMLISHTWLTLIISEEEKVQLNSRETTVG